MSEFRIQTVDGNWKWVENRAQNFLHDPDIDGILVNSRDITQRKEYEQQLEQQRDNLEVLNQVVRHDIRNDMAVISGRVNLLEEHVEESGRNDLKSIQDSAESANELTKSVRELSDIMLCTGENVGSVRLDQRLSSSIENARSKFGTAVIAVEDQLPEAHVRGDDLVNAVFRNLIQNAIVHNDKEVPRIHITTILNEDTLTVAIADNGPDIPKKQAEAIFGEDEKGLDSPGSGLGLYLVKNLVDRYSGDIWVEENDPEGSVFFIELPLVEKVRVD